MKVAVIPARYASVRLPGKPLIDLCGKTMIERVWNAAIHASCFDRVIVATDDERIAHAAAIAGAEVFISDIPANTGTDRCYQAVVSLGLEPEIVVNIQGDEPLLHPSVPRLLVEALNNSRADVATAVTRILSVRELNDPSTVKVVMNDRWEAMYFSRSAIPYISDSGHTHLPVALWKHIGIYAYRFKALRNHVNLPPSHLETAEQLEQLRLMENGAVFGCVETEHVMISVDTAEDVVRVREWLSRGNADYKSDSNRSS